MVGNPTSPAVGALAIFSAGPLAVGDQEGATLPVGDRVGGWGGKERRAVAGVPLLVAQEKGGPGKLLASGRKGKKRGGGSTLTLNPGVGGEKGKKGKVV